jgi:hypothetical protein
MIRNYLRQGDIREIFKKTMRDTELILKKIKNLRSVLLSFNYPSMNEIWDLNQKCGEFLMFGQQVARILYTVTGKQF